MIASHCFFYSLVFTFFITSCMQVADNSVAYAQYFDGANKSLSAILLLVSIGLFRRKVR